MDARLVQEALGADAHGLAPHFRPDAPSHDRVDLAMGGDGPSHPLEARQDGVRHRMPARLFRRGGEGEDLFARIFPGHRGDGRDARPALRQRAGLVEDERIRLGQRLQAAAALDEHAVARSRRNRRGKRRGRREAYAARIVDDEHIERPVHVARAQIDDERERNVDRHERRGEPVRVRLDLRLLALGVLHHADDPRNRGALADGIDADGRRPVHRERAGVDLAARLARHWTELARDGRLVHENAPFGDFAVRANLLARVDDDVVPRLERGNLDTLERRAEFARGRAPDLLALDGQHLADRVARLVHRVRRQGFGQVMQHEDGQGGSRPPGRHARDDRQHAQGVRVREAGSAQGADSAAEDRGGERQRAESGRREEPPQDRRRRGFLEEPGPHQQKPRNARARQHRRHRLFVQVALFHGKMVAFLAHFLERAERMDLDEALDRLQQVVVRHARRVVRQDHARGGAVHALRGHAAQLGEVVLEIGLLRRKILDRAADDPHAPRQTVREPALQKRHLIGVKSHDANLVFS